jgi:hypothetical protein
MATLFGGTHARANSPAVPLPNLTLAIQTSVQGRARPLVWGTAMLAGNLIDLLDFTPALVNVGSPSPASVGGKGAVFRSPQSTQPTYEWTYYATVVTSLCEGPITSVNAFTGDGLTMSTYGGGTGGGTVFLGSQTQSAFGPLATNHPDHALTYRGEAYIAWSPMYLGTNPTVPNFTFEITGGIHSAGSDFPLDANPRDVVTDYISNTQYGIPGFPSSLVAGMALYAAWCQANGLVVSPALTDQVEAASFITTMAQATYAEPVWSNGVFDMIPYGEFALAGHGATYTPNTTPDYDLVLDDFLPLQGGAGSVGSGDSPVSIDRADPQTLINNVRIEYLDRSKIYVATEIDEKDEASIATTRERPSDVRDMHMFKLGSAAATSAAYQLRRARVGTTYYFTLPKHFVLIDLMDLVQLPLDVLGLSDEPQIVRIKEIQENADRSFTFTAEDFDGATLPPLYLRQASTHSVPDFNADPGAINAPLLFEMPAAADPTASTAMIYAAVSGGANYGGSDVYTSTDGVNYILSAKIKGNARMGVTTTLLPSIGGTGTADLVDIGDTLGVDLTQSQGQLGNGSLNDMLNRATLCYIGGELIAYELALLTAANKYNLTPLLRGAYGSTISAHAIGAAFVRIDGNIAHIPYEKARAGTTIYIKFVPFNRYGGGQATLASATAYSYKLAGTALEPEDTTNSDIGQAVNADFVGAVNAHKEAATALRAGAAAKAGVVATQSTLADLQGAFASFAQGTYAQFGFGAAATLAEQSSRVSADLAVANTNLSTVAAFGAADFDAANKDFVDAVNSAAADRSNLRSAAVALAGVQTTQDALATANGAVASLSTTIFAQFGQVSASIQINATAIASTNTSLASLTTTVTAQGVTITSNTTAISGNTTSINGINTNLSGRYTLDIDVSGKIAGFSLINGGGAGSSFDVRADKFNVWASGFSNTPVFSVSTVGGVAGVTINGAYLGDLSALNNAIGNNAISHGARQVGGSGLSGAISVSARAGARLRAIAYWSGVVSNVANSPTVTVPGTIGITLDGVTTNFPGAYIYDSASNTFTFVGTIAIASMVNGGTARTISASAAAFYSNAGGSISLPVNVTIELDEISK